MVLSHIVERALWVGRVRINPHLNLWKHGGGPGYWRQKKDRGRLLDAAYTSYSSVSWGGDSTSDKG